MSKSNNKVDNDQAGTSEWAMDETIFPAIKELAKMISEIKFGTIQVVIQDGLIIQIEKTEKIRLK